MPETQKEKLGKLQAEIRSLADKASGEDTKADWSAEDEKRWTELNTEFNTLKAEADDEKRKADEAKAIAERVALAEEVERFSLEPTGDRRAGRENYDGHNKPGEKTVAEKRSLAFAGWLKSGSGNEEQRAAATELGIDVADSAFDFPEQPIMPGQWRQHRRDILEQRLQQGLSQDSAGGFTVAETLMTSLERARLLFGGVSQVADIMTTPGDGLIKWPMIDDTSNTGSSVEEGGTISTTTVTFKQFMLGSHKVTSSIVRISSELLRSSVINMESEIGSLLGERIGRKENALFTTGTGGSNQPQGIVVGSVAGKTAASATAIVSDELLDLQHSVDPEYRNMPSAGWMFHDNVLLVIRKLKDGNGRYLLQDSIQAGVPGLLLGKPFQINQSMASAVAASAKTVLFGELAKYKIRRVAGLRIVVFRELYGATDEIGIVAHSNSDGGVFNAGTDPIKHLIQSA